MLKLTTILRGMKGLKKYKKLLAQNVGRQTFKKLCIFRSQQVDFLHILHTWRIFQ